MALFPVHDDKYAAIYAAESAMVDASELIAEALQNKEISRSDLAQMLGVSRSEITARLQGERNITVRKLAETLHALGERLELRLAPKTVEDSRDAYLVWQHRTKRRPGRVVAAASGCSHSVRQAEKFRTNLMTRPA
ncbi:helix-turn-helix domain-containing protein [Subtercola boreus]|nr:helix-turn-helix transcriptional regulator [Subtercola boreus]